MKFFAPAGQYDPCGMFTLTHLFALFGCLLIVTVLLIITRHWNHHQVKRIIRILAVVLSIIEVGKIIFNFFYGYTGLDNWLPLYFCSLFLYALWMAGFGNRKIANIGLGYLFGAGFVCGLAFLVVPSTSFTTYPLFHFLSSYSMLFHSAMCFIGIQIVITGYYQPKWRNIRYYITFCSIFITLALVINFVFHVNMMFLMKPYKIPILLILYNLSPLLYTSLMVIGHATLPFIVTYGGYFFIAKIPPQIILKGNK